MKKTEKENIELLSVHRNIAMRNYREAKIRFKKDGPESSNVYFEYAFQSYSMICTGESAILDDYVAFVDIVMHLKKFAQDKADWEKWLQLKNKFGEA